MADLVPRSASPDETEDRPGTLTAATEAHPDQAAQAARRRRWKRVGGIASALLFAVAVVVLVQIVRGLDFEKVRTALIIADRSQLFAALGLTACSYLLLTCYDALALRQIGAQVAYRTTALASFASYAISFTLGFPLLTAGTVRYWIYSPAGLKAAAIASLTLIAGITFWLGMGLVLGLGLLLKPTALSEVNHLAVSVNNLIGIALVGSIVAYLWWVSARRRAIRVQGWTLSLPSFRVTMGQMVLGALDVCCAGGVLYVLLPAYQDIGYQTFLAIYVFACLLGIASHAPGGLGVFEATILIAMPAQSRESLLGSLLLYRLCYYLLPFVLSLALLGAREVVSHWSAMRGAYESGRDGDEPG